MKQREIVKQMHFVDDDSLSPLSSGELNEDMRFWVNTFLEDKELRKVAPKTLKSYTDALDTFMIFVEKYSKFNTMENIGAKFINRYLIEYQASLSAKKISQLKKKKESIDRNKYELVNNQVNEKFLGKNDASFIILDEFSTTLDHRLTVVKMLLKYVSDNNEDEHDYFPLFRKFTAIRHKDKFTCYLSVDEIDEVIDFMSIWTNVYKNYKSRSSKHIAYRDSLLLLIYALTGARSEEVVKIRLEDIDEFSYDNKEYYNLRILEGKGDKIREIAIEKGFIKNHIDYFKSTLPDKSYYLSSTLVAKTYTNKPHHQDNIRKFANYILKILSIDKTGLHSFRRGYATKRVMQDKVDLVIVAKELGNSASVLERYYIKYDSKSSLKK